MKTPRPSIHKKYIEEGKMTEEESNRLIQEFNEREAKALNEKIDMLYPEYKEYKISKRLMSFIHFGI